ncbi:ISSpo7, transposase [Salipiger bermudensis HTCC2601]|uniref:ISSpo7, transposase n=1 Tax=Salipiger bermudensis (strain DSM 26914 / JCM 13377 / KCTC 12554 / HTCC2601) TaxID=314265 RepID=Q0FJD0_SALBH|nr:ISSpo7, transposase [Salipiger bermudensis HTCC2601]
MNTKLHAVADAKGRPIGFFMSAGQVSDYTGAAALLSSLPKAGWLLADRGYDADWFREALKDKGIKVCIPGRKSRKKAVKYDKRRYKRRNRIEIMFGRLKDWETVRNSVPRRVDYAIGKRSSNMMASWLFTACHSRTERFHS